MRNRIQLAVCIGGFIQLASVFGTPVSSEITYQGQLKNNGEPLEGTVQLAFKFFDVEAGGSPLATQTFPGVHVEHGLFTVIINGAGQAELVDFNGDQRWLQISVNGTALTPRQKLTATPYATLSSKPWTLVGADAIMPGGNLGIGTNAPTEMIHLHKPFADTALRFQSSRFQEGPPAQLQKAPVNAASTGSGEIWASPSSAIFSDDVYANAHFTAAPGGPDNATSQFLDLTNFGFSLPPTAVIVGISGQVEGHDFCSCSDCDLCQVPLTVELIGGSGPSSQFSNELTPSDQSYPIGNTFEMWGLQWTPAQINASSFGARVSAALDLSTIFACFPAPFGCVYQACDCTGNGTAFVDSLVLTVSYYDVSATTTPLDWTVGLSQDDSNFRVSPSADLSNPAIIVTTAGNVGIGHEPTVESSGPFGTVFYKFDVNGDARVNHLTQSSSRRFKTDVHPVENAMDKVMGLQGVSYQWDAAHGGTPDVGFIAEDVAKVIPQIVDMEPNGKDAVGLRYDRISVFAVEAIKQLNAELKSRDAEIAALKERIEKLEQSHSAPPPIARGDKGE
ncbi:MAG: tail fiber domain-containing protein [Planctomycetes bacterium]|nr:tail fiber domain-containing protein [Planctomycetota bacterium]MBI3833029.1 tail fiber domain-containing protein [Planctomycetota bacterium]